MKFCTISIDFQTIWNGKRAFYFVRFEKKTVTYLERLHARYKYSQQQQLTSQPFYFFVFFSLSVLRHSWYLYFNLQFNELNCFRVYFDPHTSQYIRTTYKYSFEFDLNDITAYENNLCQCVHMWKWKCNQPPPDRISII